MNVVVVSDTQLGGETATSGRNKHQEELGVLAMTCINELLDKNCVPIEFEEFLLHMFQQTFQLLQRITTSDSDVNTASSSWTENKLAQLDDWSVIYRRI